MCNSIPECRTERAEGLLESNRAFGQLLLNVGLSDSDAFSTVPKCIYREIGIFLVNTTRTSEVAHGSWEVAHDRFYSMRLRVDWSCKSD